MAERWVVNASPLILLAKVGQASLLVQLPDEVFVPQAVVREILAGPKDDLARAFLLSKKVNIVDTPPPPVELIAWDLGAGETAVLTYALANSNWTAIIDDGAARRCARSFSLSHKGTLAVVLLARQRSLIPSAAKVLRDLRANGFRIDDNLVAATLHETVGEDW